MTVLLLSGSALGASAHTAAASPHRARAERPRLRAQCDADGYPMVGNVATKGGPAKPSEACEPARDEAALAKARRLEVARARDEKVARADRKRASDRT